MELVMKICRMKDCDWAQVSQIFAEGIASGDATVLKKLPSFEDWNKEYHSELRFIAKDGDEILGFVSIKNTGTLSIYVKNQYKQQGVGSLLIQKMKEECGRFGFPALQSVIFTNNIPSIKLHEKMGFVLQRTAKLKGENRNVCVYEWRA